MNPQTLPPAGAPGAWRLGLHTKRLRTDAAPVARRLFACICGRPLFFRNSRCLNCRTEVGYDPALGALVPVAADGARPRCANATTAASCNWLVDDANFGATLCRSCRLNRTVPDLSVPQHGLWWGRMEAAKRQLVSTLLMLALPVVPRSADDDEQSYGPRGLAFDFLRSPALGPRVVTGHVDGVITIDIEEADDARRESLRAQMREPYRALLGHLRHEIGHYYWYRLVDGSAWLQPFRTLFGDERETYSAALARHHANGAPADWPARFVSSYASAHPWEDWAESWAHYLHMVDALDTALSFGVAVEGMADGAPVFVQPFGVEATWQPAGHANNYTTGHATESATVYTTGHVNGYPNGNANGYANGYATEPAHESGVVPADPASFLSFVNAWIELCAALNELARSMGQPDFYPFVLSVPAVRKLHFIHSLVETQTKAGFGSNSSGQ